AALGGLEADGGRRRPRHRDARPVPLELLELPEGGGRGAAAGRGGAAGCQRRADPEHRDQGEDDGPRRGLSRHCETSSQIRSATRLRRYSVTNPLVAYHLSNVPE